MRILIITFLFLFAQGALAQLPAPVGGNQPSQSEQPSYHAPVTQVSVGGVSVTGLTDKQALAKIKKALSPLLDKKMRLWDGQQNFWRTRRELGASIPYDKLLESAKWLRKNGGGNVPVRFDVDFAKTKKAMADWADKADHKPQPPSLDVKDGKVIHIDGDGLEMAVEGSAWRVRQSLESVPSKIFARLVSVQKPASAGPDLSQFQYLIGEYSTKFNPYVRGRTVNLKKSAAHINGTIVPAGEVFSANKAIGPRNAKHGWKEAKMFVNGDVVDGIGAGICQSATTLYNAALLADLPIVERHQHQFRVYYAPPSRDATLYWGRKDFKFRNNTDGPIYVQTLVKRRHYIVRLYGTEPMTKDVKIRSKVLSRHKGMRSEAFRIVNGKRKVLSHDSYLPDVHH